MGCFDIFCALCGAPPHDLRMYEETITYKNLEKWLTDGVILLPNGDVRYNCEETMCINNFQENNDGEIYRYYGTVFNYEIFDKKFYFGCEGLYGIFVHADCYKCANKKVGFNLRYCDFPCVIENISKHSYGINCFNVNYGGIEKYWMQDFDANKLIDDKNTYMVQSPLKNTKNAKRIYSVLNQLKIKKKEGRKAPNVSATFFKDGDIKLGNDHDLYVIKNGKWIKYAKSYYKVINIYTEKLTEKASKVMIHYINNHLQYICGTYRLSANNNPKKRFRNRYDEPIFAHIKDSDIYYGLCSIPIENFIIIGTKKSVNSFLNDLPKDCYEEIN